MKYILTHCCENENCEPQIFNTKSDAINGLNEKVKEIAGYAMQNECSIGLQNIIILGEITNYSAIGN